MTCDVLHAPLPRNRSEIVKKKKREKEIRWPESIHRESRGRGIAAAAAAAAKGEAPEREPWSDPSGIGARCGRGPRRAPPRASSAPRRSPWRRPMEHRRRRRCHGRRRPRAGRDRCLLPQVRRLPTLTPHPLGGLVWCSLPGFLSLSC